MSDSGLRCCASLVSELSMKINASTQLEQSLSIKDTYFLENLFLSEGKKGRGGGGGGDHINMSLLINRQNVFHKKNLSGDFSFTLRCASYRCCRG